MTHFPAACEAFGMLVLRRTEWEQDIRDSGKLFSQTIYRVAEWKQMLLTKSLIDAITRKGPSHLRQFRHSVTRAGNQGVAGIMVPRKQVVPITSDPSHVVRLCVCVSRAFLYLMPILSVHRVIVAICHGIMRDFLGLGSRLHASIDGIFSLFSVLFLRPMSLNPTKQFDALCDRSVAQSLYVVCTKGARRC